METQKHRTNQMGVTFNEWAHHLNNQLNFSKQKLNGHYSEATMGLKPKSHRKDDRGI
jgi:hypothetical protein